MATPSFDSPPVKKQKKEDSYVEPLLSTSQSTSSQLPITSFSLFEKSKQCEPIGKNANQREDMKIYDLLDVANHLDINDITLANEHLACSCLHRFTQGKYSFLVDNEIPSMSKLQRLYASCHFRPDISVYSNQNLISIVEVHSSPPDRTLKKCILTAADIIRFFRNTNVMFSEITVFFFPKKDKKTFIASIKVKWENLRFVYTLKRHKTIDSGIQEIKDVLEENLKNFPAMPTNVSGYLMHLTQDEMKKMCGESKSSCTQLNCHRHIMIQCSGCIYKLVYDDKEIIALNELEKRVTSTPKHFVVPRGVFKFIFRYPVVHFNPLKYEQASQCVKTLVEKVKLALDELHSYGFSHNDVRLANIAFNENYDAVLIDLDRSFNEILKVHPYFGEDDISCMYSWVDNNVLDNGMQTDFFQLGWLVMWLLDKQDNYHNRKWEDQKPELKQDLFIKSLIFRGEFNDDQFCTSIVCTSIVHNKKDFSSFFHISD